MVVGVSLVILVIKTRVCFVISKTDKGRHQKKKIQLKTMKITDFNRSTIFAEVVRKLIYVDKSLFIKAIFDHDWKYHLITAPRGFGKTTILDMMKSFVEIEVDKSRKIKVEGKRNRSLFNEKLYDGSSLKIMNEKEIVDAHFGQYPVIHVDFTCYGIMDSYDDAVCSCKGIVRKAFIAHIYLKSSPLLEEDEINICKKWIDDKDKIETADIIVGLKNLARFLFKHYGGKGVFLLVDKYDSVVRKAFFDVDGDTLRRIAEFCNGILSAVLKTSDEEESEDDSKEYQGPHVARAIITGPSDIVGTSGLHNVKSNPFLRQTEFSDYFGFTDSEINELLHRLESKGNKISRNDLKKHYNGYVSKNGTSIYSLCSVLNCLNDQAKGRYYDGIDDLIKGFRTPTIWSKFQQLVLGLDVPIRFKNRMSLDDLVNLQSQFLEPELRKSLDADDIFFSFLFELGFLTYKPEECLQKDGFEMAHVRVPNKEIMDIFLRKRYIFNKNFCKLNEYKRVDYRESFERLVKLANSNEVDFKTGVEQLHNDLENLLRDAFSKKTCLRLEEAALHTSVCFVLNQSGFQYTTEYILQNEKRLDLAVVKDNCGIVLEFKYDNGRSRGTTAADALQQIKTKQYSRVFEDNKIFETRPAKIILMGLSVNDDQNLSIACVIDEREMETVYIPGNAKTGQ